jgi:hypothetical protein
MDLARKMASFTMDVTTAIGWYDQCFGIVNPIFTTVTLRFSRPGTAYMFHFEERFRLMTRNTKKSINCGRNACVKNGAKAFLRLTGE